ncbi:MAG: sugar-binding transcriptional regulator [Firmicutes bacterium]|nr:sugar-binding transcriptional regulator [Bacillota bacterium]
MLQRESHDKTEALLTSVAFLYYEKGLTLEEIARRFCVSKMTISRMLDKARLRGIVEVKIHLPIEHDKNLEGQLMKKFALKDAFVIKNPGTSNLVELLGQAGAYYLQLYLKSNDILGIAQGKTMSKVAEYMAPNFYEDLHIVQIMGGLTDVVSTNMFSVIQAFCEKLKCKGTYVHALGYASSKKRRDILLDEIFKATELGELWEKCNICMMGIGNADDTSIYTRLGFATLDELKEIQALGGVGVVLGYFVNIHGELLSCSVNERVLAMPIELLKRVDHVIAVSGGHEKIGAIIGALATGWINALVTEEETARQLLM